ncbi:MAG TPA: DUF4258 domain-containing protein [Candidatus Elarobacter sp.]|nr:DUF4258 domain-containing protein [Candidatus Elarobacter sp.]HEV2740191.1 DUF4258 domain-containing protein [Candidatus Elarobacter sp.]
MDERPLRYSAHARERMRRYRISEDEVEAIVWYPIHRIASHCAVEHYGFADDGRKLKVVTNRSETLVRTITDQERRWEHRREKERRHRERRKQR